MAVRIPYVAAFLCERVIQEKDDIFSAFRIVDVFPVPEVPPEGFVVSFHAVILLKALPTDETFNVGVWLVRPSGERDKLEGPPGQPYKLSAFSGDSTVPTGVTIVVQFSIHPKAMGVYYVEIDVDGEIVTRIPFTLRRLETERR